MSNHVPEPASLSKENVVAEASPHWWRALRFSPLTLIALLLAIPFIAWGPVLVGVLALVVAVASVVIPLLVVQRTLVTLTDRLIRIESGLFTRSHNEIRLERIESVGVRRSPLGRMLGFGELVIYGVGGNKDFLPALVRVDDFRRAVAAQIGQSA